MDAFAAPAGTAIIIIIRMQSAQPSSDSCPAHGLRAVLQPHNLQPPDASLEGTSCGARCLLVRLVDRADVVPLAKRHAHYIQQPTGVVRVHPVTRVPQQVHRVAERLDALGGAAAPTEGAVLCPDKVHGQPLRRLLQQLPVRLVLVRFVHGRDALQVERPHEVAAGTVVAAAGAEVGGHPAGDRVAETLSK